MLTTTSENTWRFDSEAADFLFPAIEDTGRVFCLHLVLDPLRLLLLRSGHGFLLGTLCLEVFVHGAEITIIEDGDLGSITLLNEVV